MFKSFFMMHKYPLLSWISILSLGFLLLLTIIGGFVFNTPIGQVIKALGIALAIFFFILMIWGFIKKNYAFIACGGMITILTLLWIQTQISVAFNEWFGAFYDSLPPLFKSKNPDKDLQNFWELIFSFTYYAAFFMIIASMSSFISSHYSFQWRIAMTQHFFKVWRKGSYNIEGASQRIQEDCYLWAKILSQLGFGAIQAIFTLGAFIPVLWHLSKGTVIMGVEVHGFYVWLGLSSSIIGIVISMIVGRKLPRLHFDNQKVEAAFRKELVIAEDNRNFTNETKLSIHKEKLKFNYFKLFKNFCYFKLWESWYNTVGNIVPFIFGVPISLIPGIITFGVLMQIARAFDQVHASFSFLINNWTTVTEAQSIYKRLREFEKQLKNTG